MFKKSRQLMFLFFFLDMMCFKSGQPAGWQRANMQNTKTGFLAQGPTQGRTVSSMGFRSVAKGNEKHHSFTHIHLYICMYNDAFISTHFFVGFTCLPISKNNIFANHFKCNRRCLPLVGLNKRNNGMIHHLPPFLCCVHFLKCSMHKLFP